MSEYIVKCKKLTGITGNELEFPEYIDTNKEIVRCMDCKYCCKHDMRAYGGDSNQLLCHFFSMSSGAGWPIEFDGFCAWGERRTNDD